MRRRRLSHEPAASCFRARFAPRPPARRGRHGHGTSQHLPPATRLRGHRRRRRLASPRVRTRRAQRRPDHRARRRAGGYRADRSLPGGRADPSVAPPRGLPWIARGPSRRDARGGRARQETHRRRRLARQDDHGRDAHHRVAARRLRLRLGARRSLSRWS